VSQVVSKVVRTKRDPRHSWAMMSAGFAECWATLTGRGIVGQWDHQCLHLTLLSLERGLKALVSSVVIWEELSVLRTEPSHVSLHDWTVNLCSGETLRFCAHQVLEVGWWVSVLVWAHGELEL
jgi:hypothetical protein